MPETGQTSLDELRRRMELAQIMSATPRQSNTAVGGGLMALAQAFAGRKAAKMGDEVAVMEQQQRAADFEKLGAILNQQGGDYSAVGQLQDPRMQELALALMAQKNQPGEFRTYKDPTGITRDAMTGDPLPGQEGYTDDVLVSPQEKLNADMASARAREDANRVARERLELDRTEQERQTRKLSAASEKAMIEAQDLAVDAGRSRYEMEALASDFETAAPLAGTAAAWQETFKRISGTEDAVTLLRSRYSRVRNSEAIKNLPPGVATDKDIELALEPFPKPTASPEHVASFLRGLSKLSVVDEAFQAFKAGYIDQNNGARGLLAAWKSSDELKAIQGQMTAQPDDEDVDSLVEQYAQ